MEEPKLREKSVRDESTTVTVGRNGENRAASYLESKGYEILDRNFRMGRQGEIDLIAKTPDDNGSSVVFFEVKYRKDLDFGRPSLAVDRRKMQRIIQTARHYMAANHLGETAVRFDILEIWWEKDHHKIHHYKNAFGEDLWTN